MQDGGPFLAQQFKDSNAKQIASLSMSCSAGGGKEPPDLNYETCIYFLDKESALYDATLNSGHVRYTFFHACPTLSRNRSYHTSCVFVQFYLQCSNQLPHHLDSVWYIFRICSLLPFLACRLLLMPPPAIQSVSPIVNATASSSKHNAYC